MRQHNYRLGLIVGIVGAALLVPAVGRADPITDLREALNIILPTDASDKQKRKDLLKRAFDELVKALGLP